MGRFWVQVQRRLEGQLGAFCFTRSVGLWFCIGGGCHCSFPLVCFLVLFVYSVYTLVHLFQALLIQLLIVPIIYKIGRAHV